MSGSVPKRMSGSSLNDSEEHELRRGPWTPKEDALLTHFISLYGEGRWNLLAKSSGLRRTGKSCRLRWLNYLKPDIKRGNLTPEEQLLILELHSRWGNRWSKIAQQLPGRTDNEIKNYWRTRVQKQAKQLNIESNSKRFLEAVRCFWKPRLQQKLQQSFNNLESTNLITIANYGANVVGSDSSNTEFTEQTNQRVCIDQNNYSMPITGDSVALWCKEKHGYNFYDDLVTSDSYYGDINDYENYGFDIALISEMNTGFDCSSNRIRDHDVMADSLPDMDAIGMY